MLLDLKMPRLGGIEVLRELKTDPKTIGIPVVVMTSSNQDRDVTESYQLGVNGYVTKPVQVGSFMEAVAEIGMYWLLTNQAPAR
jgi:CheY-like chemotaxis protein